MRARDGRLVELRNLVRLERGAAPSEITRRDRQRSVIVGANLDGKVLGDAVAEVEAIAAEILPDELTLGYDGFAEQMQESGGQFGLMMLLAVLVIYMVLAAQFESFSQPLAVMLALPFAMIGALGGLWLMDMTLNMFSMIGIVLLIGLVTKNSILLVDYANQLRDEGPEPVGGDPHGRPGADAAGADDRPVDDLRRSAVGAGDRSGQREPGSDGGRHGGRNAHVDAADAAGRAGLLSGPAGSSAAAGSVGNAAQP